MVFMLIEGAGSHWFVNKMLTKPSSKIEIGLDVVFLVQNSNVYSYWIHDDGINYVHIHIT